MKFLKLVFTSFFGLCLFFLLAAVFLAISASFSSSDGIKVKNNSILHLKLEAPIVDRSIDNPLANFNPVTMESIAQIGLYQTLNSIQAAKTDDKIKGIFIEPATFIEAGMATVEELRDALIDFKESGKFIYSYAEVYSHKSYYLSSVADSVFLFPEGMVEFTGLRSQIAFIKGTLEKLDIEPQIIRHGKFKSAIEPLILEKMSAANKEQTMTYVQDLWDQMLREISQSRGISVENLQGMADNLSNREASDALENKLVDKLIYKDELIAHFKTLLDVPEDEKIASICLSKYSAKVNKKEKSDADKVAMIFAYGGIESGKGDHETIGSESVSKMIRDAREDQEVKAIVLRVNSGGGSALASDVIWREMALAKKEKPVVVSMGDVAASGGYYIACESNEILASENSITGSIGVFGVIPNMQKFYNNKLGMTFDGVKTGNYADIYDLTKPLSESERMIIQEGVVKIYKDFIGKVAEGRSMSVAQVDSIGEGRVWSGEDAKQIGLIDEFGGMKKAIKRAAELANLEDYAVAEYPKEKDPFQIIIEQLTGQEVKERFLKSSLGKHYSVFKQIQTLEKLKGVQARLPYQINVE